MTFASQRWAERQRVLDGERAARLPELVGARRDRLRASTHAFLRGSAQLFYEILADDAALAAGPDGEGWICGDLHLENFGAFRVDGADSEDSDVIFDINDFDDATIAPWRLDVLRLTVSALMSARALKLDGALVMSTLAQLYDAYLAARAGAPGRPAPPFVLRHRQRVSERTRDQLLDARTVVVNGERRFERGPRYREVDGILAADARAAFARYAAEQLAHERHPMASAFDVVDVAWRIAGTGSLGCLRLAVLTRGKGGKSGHWIFDMKEESLPSANVVLVTAGTGSAARVVEALRICPQHPPKMLGTAPLGDASLLVRRLAPQEDKLAIDDLQAAEWPKVLPYYGSLVGAMHHRGRQREHDWTPSDVAALVDTAAELTGRLESVYWAYCRA